MEKQFKNSRVLIFGLGINQGGVGAAKFFAKIGAEVKVTDLKSENELKVSLDQLKEYPQITYTLEQHLYEDMDWAELIIKNQAVKPGNPYISYALKRGKRVEMDMGIFLQYAQPRQIIGVTGTKGKSTTASLIYEVLKKSHIGGVIFAGNIGKSVLDTIPQVKPDTLVVLEISSFQLEAFYQHQVSPKWAVITNIYPDHLNYYKSMEEYIQAKRWIAEFQGKDDFLFLRKGDEITNQDSFLTGLNGQIIYFSPKDLPADFSPKLPGEHNLENMAAALAVSQIILGPGTKENPLRVLENFRGVEFRLQLIKEWNDIKIYNDTAATSPAATIQALKSLPNSILICGGVDKGLPYEELAQAIDQYAKEVYFLEGTATENLKSLILNLKSETLKIGGTYRDLESLLEDIKLEVKSGDTILFSPGAASFNLFQNEFDRGRKFNEAVSQVFYD